MNWTDTRAKLIKIGLSPDLPLEWEPNINLRGAGLLGANLYGANLRGADLRGADLRGANLGGANLRGTNLHGANLRGANLRGADLDFASWPLWCGSFDVKADVDEALRHVYHTCRMNCDGEDFMRLKTLLAPFANKWSGIRRHGLPEIE